MKLLPKPVGHAELETEECRKDDGGPKQEKAAAD